jgi:hypothetical protein
LDGESEVELIEIENGDVELVESVTGGEKMGN